MCILQLEMPKDGANKVFWKVEPINIKNSVLTRLLRDKFMERLDSGEFSKIVNECRVCERSSEFG